MKTVGELKEWLSKFEDNTPVEMCMDWTELSHEEQKARGLDQQWQDELGGVSYNGRAVILLNKHFK